MEEKNEMLINEQYADILKEDALLKETESKIIRNMAVALNWLCSKFPDLKAILPFEASELCIKREESEELIKAKLADIASLGKVIQTLEGDGSITNPFKGWSVGMTVELGKWYLTSEGYLWECIKSGTPTSETDSEYFDVVGLVCRITR